MDNMTTILMFWKCVNTFKINRLQPKEISRQHKKQKLILLSTAKKVKLI